MSIPIRPPAALRARRGVRVRRNPGEEREAGMLTNRAFRHRRQRGASLVELALVLFILLLILAGIVDFGRVFNHYVVITNASREGAR
ncbi:MAG: TadE/TadG family type IV pilus assembly protein, partial [Chloroflexota bacterium]